MGLIIMAGVTVLGLTEIAFAAAVVSFISLLNAAIALRRGYRHVDIRLVKWVLLGLLPSLGVGLLLLDYLSTHAYAALKLMLGIVVIVAGVSLMISPRPFKSQSGSGAFTLWGVLGGVLAGLYSAGGAPLAYFVYRQPIALDVVRFSLLAVFAVSTAIRALMVGVSGQLNAEILQISLLSVPVVVLMTLGTSRYLHLIPDKLVRVIVFIVLMLAGSFLVGSNLDGFDLPIAQVPSTEYPSIGQIYNPPR